MKPAVAATLLLHVGTTLVLGQHPVLPKDSPPVEYSIPPNSVQILKMPVENSDVPSVPSCSALLCDQGAHNRLVCAGVCPAGCECSDAWVVEVMTGVGTANPALAFSISNTAIDASVAYDAFVNGNWRVVPFITAHEHFRVTGPKGTGLLQSDLVDLCMPTALMARAGSGSQAVLYNYSQMDCNCDDCAHSCGLAGSRKGSSLDQRNDYDHRESCPQPWPYEAYDSGASRGCSRHTACETCVGSAKVCPRWMARVDYSLCTYYSASNELSRSAYNSDFCCNGHPLAFEDAIGALSGLQHPFGFMEEFTLPKVTFPVASEVNLTACGSEDGEAEIMDYIVPPVMFTACSRSDMQVGDYYLYVVNTGTEPADVTLGYQVRLLTPEETHACVITGASDSGAIQHAFSWGVTLVILFSYL